MIYQWDSKTPNYIIFLGWGVGGSGTNFVNAYLPLWWCKSKTTLSVWSRLSVWMDNLRSIGYRDMRHTELFITVDPQKQGPSEVNSTAPNKTDHLPSGRNKENSRVQQWYSLPLQCRGLPVIGFPLPPRPLPSFYRANVIKLLWLLINRVKPFSFSELACSLSP